MRKARTERLVNGLAVDLGEMTTPLVSTDALVEALNKAKPASSKGVYLRKVAVSSTMGVGVRVDTQSIAAS